jgi:hypothetical protein
MDRIADTGQDITFLPHRWWSATNVLAAAFAG